MIRRLWLPSIDETEKGNKIFLSCLGNKRACHFSTIKTDRATGSQSDRPSPDYRYISAVVRSSYQRSDCTAYAKGSVCVNPFGTEAKLKKIRKDRKDSR